MVWDAMGHFGDVGSQGFRDEEVGLANDTGVIVEERQVTADVEAKGDIVESEISQKKFVDRDVDTASLAKIVVRKIVGKGKDGDWNAASQDIEAVADAAENGVQSRVTDIRGTEQEESHEVDVMVSGLGQFASWEDALVVGATSDYGAEDFSLVSNVGSDPTGILGSNGSLFFEAQDRTAVEGKIPSPPVDLEQASPRGSSLVSKTLVCDRDKALPVACMTGLTAAEIWDFEGEDVDLHCPSSAYLASEKTGMAELKDSGSCVVQDVAATPQFTQEIDSRGRFSPVMPSIEARQQDAGSAEATTFCSSEIQLTTRLDEEERNEEVHASAMHDGRIITGEAVIAPTDASEGVRQEASSTSFSVPATETTLLIVMEKEFVDEEQLVFREAGDSPLPVFEASKESNEIQFKDVPNLPEVSRGGKVDELSGSMIQAISVHEAPLCNIGSNVPGPFVPDDPGDDSENEFIARPTRVEITDSPVEELTGSNLARPGAGVRLDTTASGGTVEKNEGATEMSEPKASIRDEQDDDLAMEEVVQEAVSRKEDREDTVMKDVPREEGAEVDEALDGGSQIAEGLSNRVQDATEKLKFAEVLVDFETTRVEAAESEREVDIMRNLVGKLSTEVLTRQEELSGGRDTATIESPTLVRGVRSNVRTSSAGPAAPKLDISDGFSRCNKENSNWKYLILQGVNLLRSVGADIQLKKEDTMSFTRGETELYVSDELKGNRVDESLAETVKTQADRKSESAVDGLFQVPKIDHPVVTKIDPLIACTELERTAVAGASNVDEGRSLGTETLTEASQEGCQKEEVKVKVLETRIMTQVVDGLGDYGIVETEVAGSKSCPTIAVDYGIEVCNSVVQESSEEGGTEKKEREDSGDGSPALGNKQFETCVIPETTHPVDNLQVPVAEDAIQRHSVERCCVGSQHSIKDGPEVIAEGLKAASDECDFHSGDPPRGTCSLDTKVSVARVTPGEDSGDGSPDLGNKQFETCVIPETTDPIGDLQVPVADDAVHRPSVERCFGGSQHSVKDGPEVITEGLQSASDECDFHSGDSPRGTCSLDTKVCVARVEAPGEKTEAAFWQDKYSVFDRSQSSLKCKVGEIALECDRISLCMQPIIMVEDVQAVSTHDSLPVAKQTLPVVPIQEAAPEQAMETTLFTSHPGEERKGSASIKGTSKILAEYQEGQCASADELAQKKLSGAGLFAGGGFPPTSCKEAEAGEDVSVRGLENLDRLGMVRATDATVTGDVAQITHVDVLSHDGKDPIKIPGLRSTIFVESAENLQWLIASQEGSVRKKTCAAVEAGESNLIVAVKKKLQTKRKKLTGETEKKTTEVDPVLCSSPRIEGATNHIAIEMHGSEGLVRILDDTGASPLPPENSAADQAIILWLPEADGVEGSSTDLISGDKTQALALMCNCGKPAVLKTVGYKSQNRGLRYYSCEGYKPTFFTRKRNRKRDNKNLTSCRFFQWLDSPRVSMEDKKEIRLQKKRQLEQILAAKAVTTNYSTRSSSKQELADYEADKNQGLIKGAPPVSGLSVEEPKHENSEEPEPSVKKPKLSRIDPSLSTADSVAFSTRASAARKRKGPCVVDTNDRSTSGNSSCGDESFHEVSVGDWTDSDPKEVAKRVKSEAEKGDTPTHTYSRRGKSSRPLRRSGYMPGVKNIGRMERGTADTNHVLKLLPVSLAYEKSREVVLEESSDEKVSGDQKEESNEEENCLGVCSSEEEPLETPSSTSAEREKIPVRLRSQRPSSHPKRAQNGRHTKPSGKRENSRRNLQTFSPDASASETSLYLDLKGKVNQPSQWIDVPLTCPFENKESSRSGILGHQAVQHGVGQYGSLVCNHDVVVNFPTASPSGERRTISSNTLLLVKEKAREASLAVNLRREKSSATETQSLRVAWTKSADRIAKRSEGAVVSDSDEEETGPSGSRGLRSLKDMLKRENSDGTVADYEVADESQPPYCECKTVKRRAALKTVLSNSANQGLRYWVCVNHRPLFQKKSLWEGDPNDESCKFFRWLDTPIISYAERKKQLAARRRRNERRRR